MEGNSRMSQGTHHSSESGYTVIIHYIQYYLSYKRPPTPYWVPLPSVRMNYIVLYAEIQSIFYRRKNIYSPLIKITTFTTYVLNMFSFNLPRNPLLKAF